MKNNILISTIIALIVSTLMMYVAWEHNPQGEIDFGYLTLLGMSWFVMVFLVIFIIVLIAKKMWKYFNAQG